MTARNVARAVGVGGRPLQNGSRVLPGWPLTPPLRIWPRACSSEDSRSKAAARAKDRGESSLQRLMASRRHAHSPLEGTFCRTGSAQSDSESALSKTTARRVPSHTNGSARPADSWCSSMGCSSEPPFHASFSLLMQPPVYISTWASTPVPGLSSHSQTFDPSLRVSRLLGARHPRLQDLPCSKEEPLRPLWDPLWSSGLPELACSCECACPRMQAVGSQLSFLLSKFPPPNTAN